MNVIENVLAVIGGIVVLSMLGLALLVLAETRRDRRSDSAKEISQDNIARLVRR